MPFDGFTYKLPLHISAIAGVQGTDVAQLTVPVGWQVYQAGAAQPMAGGAKIVNLQANVAYDLYVLATNNGGNARNTNGSVEFDLTTLKNGQPNRPPGDLGKAMVTPFFLSHTNGVLTNGAGPTDVPQFGTYEYNVKNVQGGQWLATGSGINPEPIKNNASDVNIPWGAAQPDDAVYQADPQYIWDMPVNIFTITVNPGPNGAAYGGQVKQILQTEKGSAPGLITVTTTTFNMDASVTVQGPNGTTGMQHLTVGFVQNLAPVVTKAEYRNGPGTQGAEVGSTLLNGGTIDMGNPPKAAFWDTQNTSKTIFYSDDGVAKITGAQLLKNQTNEISTLDAPKVSMPRSLSRFGGMDQLKVVWNLSMYVVVSTDEVPSAYVPEAYLPWTFNGTGNVNGNVWTGNGSGISFRTPGGTAQWLSLQGAAAGGEPPFNTGGHQFNSLIQNAAENGASTIVLNKSTFP